MFTCRALVSAAPALLQVFEFDSIVTFEAVESIKGPMTPSLESGNTTERRHSLHAEGSRLGLRGICRSRISFRARAVSRSASACNSLARRSAM